MPELPPDPRAVIDARIHRFKKQSQKLNLEFLEAEADLERAKQAVRQSKQATAAARVPTVVSVPQPVAVKPSMVIRPFAEGVGYALKVDGAELWFDTEAHAVTYARDVFPHCEVFVLQRDGTLARQ